MKDKIWSTPSIAVCFTLFILISDLSSWWLLISTAAALSMTAMNIRHLVTE
ncbi:hypothetical protein [Corynebacterium antarcticum]|uniref:hypothetical protein n=1 Tax=Corynebacterium antarcticum TaxID=2800405 RepID=UPI00200511EF|nr:hypothetical protein [Corynebacterium antarcticum]MCK7662000.1 hypothetical protein [Corynebacterium antarcticum]